MTPTKIGVHPHVKKTVICVCMKRYCIMCLEQCPKCSGLHIKFVAYKNEEDKHIYEQD